MAIQATVTVEVASVDVNDDFRVELTQMKLVTDYSPEEALQLAEELAAAASNAQSMLDEHLAHVASRQRSLVVDGETIL